MRLVFFDVGPGPTMMNTEVFNCENMSDDEIDLLAYNLALEQTERYGDFFVEDDEIPEDRDDQYFTDSDLSYSWEDYAPEKHDCQRCGGGSFMDEFKE